MRLKETAIRSNEINQNTKKKIVVCCIVVCTLQIQTHSDQANRAGSEVNVRMDYGYYCCYYFRLTDCARERVQQ